MLLNTKKYINLTVLDNYLSNIPYDYELYIDYDLIY